MAFADGAVVEFADGRQFGGGAAEERFVGIIDFIAGEQLFFHGVAEIAGDLDDGVAGDAVEDGGQRRGLDHAVADDEEVFAGRFADVAVGVEHQGFVITVLFDFHLGEHGVHIVAGGLGLAHQGVDVHTGEGAGLDADTLFEGFGSEVGAPGPHGDDDVRGVVAGEHAHVAFAGKGEGTDVAFGKLVGHNGFDDRLGNFVGGIGHVDAKDFGGIDEALGMLR